MVEKDWFRHAFDVSYIGRYAHRGLDEAQRLVSSIHRLFPHGTTGKKALDVACGAGRHALALHRLGFRVTGFDLSEDLIRLARRQARKESMDIDFFVLDMREPWPDEQFDLIINAFTSFGYFETDEESAGVIRQVWNRLAPGGLFVLDYFHAEHVRSTLVPKSEKKMGRNTFIEKRWIENGRVNKQTTRLDDREQIIQTMMESVRLFEPEQIRRMTREAGLTIKEEWGDYSGAPMDGRSSRYILVAARIDG